MARDAPQRTRSCRRDQPTATTSQSRGSRPIGLPLDRLTSHRLWDDARAVRRLVEDLGIRHPDLFPTAMTQGFTGCGTRPPSQKRAGIGLRRVRVTVTDEAGRATTADFFRRPRLVWPSGGGTVEEVENGWRRLRSGVPDQVVASCRGRPALFWDRLERSPGRPSVVGTTARDPRAWPPHRAADEPQAQRCGENATVAVTAGGPCLGGIALSHTAGEVDLTAASGRFQDEAAEVSAESTPETVNTDGGKATQAAGRTWFPKVAVIWCFRHGSWKIRDRGRTAFELPRTVREVYRATSARAFREARESFRRWCAARVGSGPIPEALEKLWGPTAESVLSSSPPGGHRTSNPVDRPLNARSRLLYAHRTRHGPVDTAESRRRGWARLRNGRPFEPQTRRRTGDHSAAPRQNTRKYHAHGLHNLDISASLGGFRA